MPGVGDGLHAGGDPDHRSDRRVVGTRCLDCPDHDLSRIDAGPDSEGDPVLCLEPDPEAVEAVAQPEGHAAGPHRVVLLRDWRSEDRHCSIPRELVDGSVESFYLLPEDLQEIRQDRAPDFRIEASGETQ